MEKPQFVIITGLSGAGKSLAMHCLEDLGYFCMDNLPPALLPKFAEICLTSGGRISRVALVMDIRGGEFFDDLAKSLAFLEEISLPFYVLFLEADDETLVNRYKESRRRHPLAPGGGILEGIRRERAKLEEIRGKAHKIIDTSNLTPHQFKEEMFKLFSGDGVSRQFVITLVTFGFKYGIPMDADLVFDVRFLPNPHYVSELRELDGRSSSVEDYVLKWPVTKEFLRKLSNFLLFLIPHYINEGKPNLTIGIGCTGGHHRSVVVANRLARVLRNKKYCVMVEHRDMTRRGEEDR